MWLRWVCLQVKALYQQHCVDADGTLGSTAQRTLGHAGEGVGCPARHCLDTSVVVRSLNGSQRMGRVAHPKSEHGIAKAPSISCTLPPCCPRVRAESGSDLGGEYARQRNYLEKTIDSLKRKLAADAEAHRTGELRIMGQNVSLIRELNELRREIKVAKRRLAVAHRMLARGWHEHSAAVQKLEGQRQHIHKLTAHCCCCVQVLKSAPLTRSTAATRPVHATGSHSSSLSPEASSSTGARSNVPSRAGSTRLAAGGSPSAAQAGSKAQPPQQQPQQQPPPSQQQQPDPNLLSELSMQRELIAKLQAQLEARDGRIKALESAEVQAAAHGLRQPDQAADAAEELADAAGGLHLGGAPAVPQAAAEPSSGAADAGRWDTADEPAVQDEGAAAAAAPARPMSGLGSRSASMSSSKGRPGSAAGSRRTSAGQQRVLSHAGSGNSRAGGSSSNSRVGLGSRPQSGVAKGSAVAAAATEGDPAPWQADDEEVAV